MPDTLLTTPKMLPHNVTHLGPNKTCPKRIKHFSPPGVTQFVVAIGDECSTLLFVDDEPPVSDNRHDAMIWVIEGHTAECVGGKILSSFNVSEREIITF
jgi:hypothetical protein